MEIVLVYATVSPFCEKAKMLLRFSREVLPHLRLNRTTQLETQVAQTVLSEPENESIVAVLAHM